jgi:hypothetical protein
MGLGRACAARNDCNRGVTGSGRVTRQAYPCWSAGRGQGWGRHNRRWGWVLPIEQSPARAAPEPRPRTQGAPPGDYHPAVISGVEEEEESVTRGVERHLPHPERACDQRKRPDYASRRCVTAAYTRASPGVTGACEASTQARKPWWACLAPENRTYRGLRTLRLHRHVTQGENRTYRGLRTLVRCPNTQRPQPLSLAVSNALRNEGLRSRPGLYPYIEGKWLWS